MQITVEELTTNPDLYLNLLDEKDVFITRNGKSIAKLTGIKPKQSIADSLFGILPADIDLDKARMERLSGNESK